MADGLYTALSGGAASLDVLDVLANNLANASSHGYKVDRAVFSEVLEAARSAPSGRSHVALRGTVVDTTQGALKETRNPLDVAISGQGFFAVQAPQGIRYTRRGDFRLSADGKLVTAAGHDVLGQRGAVKLTAGDVRIDEKGGVHSGGRQIDRLRIVDLPATSLRKEGDALFDSTAAPQPAGAQILQGQLEASNVSAVGTMNALMVASRTFELAVQMMQSFRRMDEKLISDMGKGT
jgi:flagellar basal-body rod protein FlgG